MNYNISYDFVNELNNKTDAFQYVFDKSDNKYLNAFHEAENWMKIGYYLESCNIYHRHSYVLLTLAAELFIKTLLIKSNSKIEYTHNLNNLFNCLNLKTKNIIIANMKLSNLELIDINDNIIGELINFYDYLKYISKNFVELRYDYEKIDKSTATIVPRKFINDFVFVLYSQCIIECNISE